MRRAITHRTQTSNDCRCLDSQHTRCLRRTSKRSRSRMTTRTPRRALSASPRCTAPRRCHTTHSPPHIFYSCASTSASAERSVSLSTSTRTRSMEHHRALTSSALRRIARSLFVSWMCIMCVWRQGNSAGDLHPHRRRGRSDARCRRGSDTVVDPIEESTRQTVRAATTPMTSAATLTNTDSGAVDPR